MIGKEKPIIIVIGGQYGSEGKGAVAAKLVMERGVDIAVRTGGVNAGHTVYWKGEAMRMQQLPVGWIKDDTLLVLGPGAIINPEVLDREIEMVEKLTGKSLDSRLHIDPRATYHGPEHAEMSRNANRHYAIGATGKGVGDAYVTRIMNRGGGARLLGDRCSQYQKYFLDTVQYLNDAYDTGRQILLEGAQGSGLDILTGPYPYTTHKPTQASQWIVEAGLAPGLKYEVVMVLRTLPIRVAGNSGPLYQETTWPEVARRMNERMKWPRRERVVDEEALEDYEKWRWEISREEYGPFRDLKFEKWSDEERRLHRAMISELDTCAFNLLDPLVQSHLLRVFERTTVTKKIRRVGMFDVKQVKEAVMMNRPAYAALTFLDHEFPELHVPAPSMVPGMLGYPAYAQEYVKKLGEEIRVEIAYAGLGPNCLVQS